MNLQQLEYFCEIAKTQNMTRSAERLHVSQPALSSTIKSLETELGVSLFDRKGRSIVLNDNGREFLKSVNSIFGILGRNKQKATLLGEGKTEIVIGASGTELGLVPYMRQFMELHPQVAFRCVSHAAVQRMHADETVDFLIGANPQIHEGRVAITLGEASFSVVYQQGMLTDGAEEFQLETLKDMNLIFCCPPDVKTPGMLRNLQAAGIRPNCMFIADDRITVLAMLQEGNCVAIIPTEDARVYTCGSDRLKYCELSADTFHMHREVKISWAKNREISPAAQEFISYLRRETVSDSKE